MVTRMGAVPGTPEPPAAARAGLETMTSGLPPLVSILCPGAPGRIPPGEPTMVVVVAPPAEAAAARALEVIGVLCTTITDGRFPPGDAPATLGEPAARKVLWPPPGAESVRYTVVVFCPGKTAVPPAAATGEPAAAAAAPAFRAAALTVTTLCVVPTGDAAAEVVSTLGEGEVTM